MLQKTHHNIDQMHLTFIGSGISTSFTLIPLLKELSKKKHLKIAVVEKDEEFHTGIAYGPRSGPSALLITSLSDFLPEGEERNEFIQWLTTNKKELINKLRQSGGELSEKWIQAHTAEIERGQWEDIYIPRRFFGIYIKDKTQRAIEQFNKSNEFPIEYINSEAIDIQKVSSGYKISFTDRAAMTTSKVVVSVGIPPIAEVWSEEELSKVGSKACLISYPYNQSLPDNLQKIESFIAKKNKKVNVLIIGANASAMEMIYKLNDVANIKKHINEYYVISPKGELPNSAKDSNLNVDFLPKHLLQLQSKPNLTALEIYEAANKDLNVAESLNYGTSISEAPVSKAFTSLLSALDSHELREFACHYGNEIGKRQRRAGKHYTDVVDQLRTENRLTNIQGYFVGLKENSTQKVIQFKFKLSKSATVQQSTVDVDIIINCMGSKTLNRENISPLLDNLISSGLCKSNDSNRGICVNSSFETSPGLYIMGPLLAGNLINNVPLWHIEHCGRIIYLGKNLANHLWDNLRD